MNEMLNLTQIPTSFSVDIDGRIQSIDHMKVIPQQCFENLYYRQIELATKIQEL